MKSSSSIGKSGAVFMVSRAVYVCLVNCFREECTEIAITRQLGSEEQGRVDFEPLISETGFTRLTGS